MYPRSVCACLNSLAWVLLLSSCTSLVDDASLTQKPGTQKPGPTPEAKPVASVDPLSPSLPGPDGREYPNFTFAGLPEDTVYPKERLRIHEFGAKAGENAAPALRKAIAKAKEMGGAVIEFGHGTYFLDEPVQITASNIVIRGQGRGGPGYFSTTLEFRFAPDPHSLEFIFTQDGDTIHPEGFVGVVAHPGLPKEYWEWTLPGNTRKQVDPSGQLAKIELFIDGKPWFSKDTIKDHHFAPQTALIPFIHHLWQAKFQEGQTPEILARATWKNGKTAEKQIRIHIDASLPDSNRSQPDYGILSFAGPSRYAQDTFFQLDVTEPITRGDTSLTVNHPGDFEPGDVLRLRSGKPDFIPHGTRYAQELFRVVAVNGTTIHLSQPVRLDIPVEAKPTVRKQVPLRNVGVEHLTIRQTSDTWSHGIVMKNVLGGWVRNVELVNIGRCPVYFSAAKNCEVRDVVMNGSQYPLAGGMSAYAGWYDSSNDCLMENVTALRLRHAPNFQGQSSGNVVRNSTFEMSDLQFHAFFPYENLVENCRIYATVGSGSYGYGLYTSKVHSMHQQSGPRNVVYGNDIQSPKGPVFFGGAETGWVIAYNRFQVEDQSPFLRRDPMPAVELQEGSHGNLFLKNLFVLQQVDDVVRVSGEPGRENVFEENLFMQVKPGEPATTLDGWTFTWTGNEFLEAIDPALIRQWQPPPSLYLYQKQLVESSSEPVE